MSTLQGGPGNIVTDGLILCLDAANHLSYPGSGNTWTDIAGSNDGTLTNGPTFNSENAGSIVFDGVDDNVTIPYSKVNNIIPGLTSLTISTWVYLTNLPVNGINFAVWPMSNNSAISPFTVFGFGCNQDTTLRGGVGDGTTRTNLTSDQQINLNSWFNVGLIYDGSNINTFVNGIISSTSASASYTLGTSSNNADLYIGSYNTNNVYWLDGKMSSIKIYNRALTSSEITQNYNATKGRFGL